MRRRSLLWQLFTQYLLITLAALLLVTWGAWQALTHFDRVQTEQDLEARARIVSGTVAPLLASGDTAALDAFCKQTGRSSATRITVILPSGKVAGDSHHDIATMDNHAHRPEVARALAGKRGISVRGSATLREQMMYLAIPLQTDGRVVGVIRTAIPLTSYTHALTALYAQLSFELLVIIALVAVVSLAISRRINRPLAEARQAAERFALGDLQNRLPVTGTAEVAGLAEAMNGMAAQLNERFRTIIRQRMEQEAVLRSMVEGLLAIDNDEHLLKLNRAAAQFLEINMETAQGHPLLEVVRNSDLQRFVTDVLHSEEPRESEIVIRPQGEQRFIQLHGTRLSDEEGHRIGALVVMNDVTHLRRLETVRRDFVANVSHELKTPITSIKGFVETLLDGAVQNPEDAERFLKIIARHADRLNAIVEDLLALSRLEQDGEEASLTLEPGLIWPVLEAAVQTCEVKAREKQITVEIAGDQEVRANINPALLEQAFINLIDNAIKYSPSESRVRVEVEQAGEEILVHVRDQGCGIPREHLPRVFERFYRVDTGRSRKLGGTGLGLAIVKHITQTHQGRMTVDSTSGKGSTFTMHLPAPDPAPAQVSQSA